MYAITISSAAFIACKFSAHRVVWLMVLAASIPIFAALVGGLTDAE
jgi:hypothetical protein